MGKSLKTCICIIKFLLQKLALFEHTLYNQEYGQKIF